MMHFSFRFVVSCIVGILTVCESKVIINFRLYNYQNPNDIKHDGYKCESFHWMNDYCDPMFHICVTSRYRCDVLNISMDHWKNKKYVYNIISKKIKLNYMPRSLAVDVRVEDHDRFDAHDHIAVFSSTFYTSRYNPNYGNPMTASPSGLNVHLYSRITIQCEDKYYGTECETFCKPKFFNYDCNKFTGERICRVNCGNHGFCSWNISSKEFICSCKSKWTGDRCQFIHYDQCSKISCNKTCVKNEENIHCVCSYNIYIERCTERLPLSTTTVTTTMDTTILTTTKEFKETKAIYLKPFQTTNIIVQNGYVDTIKETLGQTSQQRMTQASIKYEKDIQNLSQNIFRTTNKIKSTTQDITTALYNKRYSTKNKNQTLQYNFWDRSNNASIKILSSKTKHQSNIKEAAKQQSNHIIQSTHFPTTIVIICLLIFLCICILSLVFVIRKLGKKDVRNQNGFTPSPFLQRPLPPIVFRPNLNNAKRTSSVFSNSTLPDIPQYNYDSCTIQTDYNYETSLINFPKKECEDNDELYEVPINMNADSFTMQTVLKYNSNNEDEFYEEPIKVLQT